METDKTIGAVNWMDITVPDADNLRDFMRMLWGGKYLKSTWVNTTTIV